MSGLFPVPILDHEPMMSVVSRLARANGASHARAFCRDIGLSFPALVRGEESEILRLCDLVGMRSEELRPRASVLLPNESSFIAGAAFPRGMLRRTKLRFCPHCILDDDNNENLMPGTRRHARDYWMFPQVASCPKHLTLIVQPKHDFLNRYSHDVTSQLELFDDQMLDLVQASRRRSPTPFEDYIRSRIAGSKIHGGLLDSLSLAAGITACEVFGIAKAFGRHAGARGISEDDLHRARNEGFESLARGVDGFAELLDSIRSKDDRSNVRGGQALYGKVYHSLNESREHDDYNFLRELMRRLTMDRVPVLNGSEFFGIVTDSPWTSVSSIQVATGYHDITLRKMLVELGVLDTLRQSKSERYIKKAVADDAIEKLRDMVSLDDVALILGIKLPMARVLVDAGLVTVVTAGSTDESNSRLLYRYSKSQVQSLKHDILGRARSHLPTGWAPLKVAARAAGITIAEALEMIVDGRLNHVGRSLEEDSINAIFLDPNEVEELAPKLEAGIVDRKAICSRLLLKHEGFSYLVREGHLPVQHRQIRSTRAPTLVMAAADLDEFDARYVTFGRLSKETGIGTRGIVYRLRQEGIPLAFPSDGTNQGIVERRHLVGWNQPSK